jgi:hypothetical protein
VFTEQFVEFLAEELSPLGIEFSHAFDMAQENPSVMNRARSPDQWRKSVDPLRSDLGYGIYQLLGATDSPAREG